MLFSYLCNARRYSLTHPYSRTTLFRTVLISKGVQNREVPVIWRDIGSQGRHVNYCISTLAAASDKVQGMEAK